MRPVLPSRAASRRCEKKSDTWPTVHQGALLSLPSKLADRMRLPGGARINDAIALLDELTHADELAEFLTSVAYEQMN